MTRRIIKKGNICNISAESKLSLNKKPPLYDIMMFDNAKMSRNDFTKVLEKCFNNSDNKWVDNLYSSFHDKKYVTYGPYTKDVAETIACKVQSFPNITVCCVIKN